MLLAGLLEGLVLWRRGDRWRWAAAATLIGTILLCSIAYVGVVQPRWEQASALRAGDYEVTYGLIESLDRFTDETSMSVAGKNFRFTVDKEFSGFADPLAGGHVTKGSELRVYHRSGQILKVEMCVPRPRTGP